MKITFLSFLQKRYIAFPNTFLDVALHSCNVFKATVTLREKLSPTHIPLPTSRHLGEEGTLHWGEMVKTAFTGCKEVLPMLPWHTNVEFLIWGTNIWLIMLSLLNSNFICWTNQFLFSLHLEGGGCVSPKAQLPQSTNCSKSSWQNMA